MKKMGSLIYLLIFFMVFYLPLYAQNATSAENAGHFDDHPSRARVPNVSIPTGFIISKDGTIFSSNIDKEQLKSSQEKLSFEIDINDKSIWALSSKKENSDPTSYHNLFFRMGAKFGSLDSELQLNLMEALSQHVIGNGLIAKPSQIFLEKVWVSWEAFSIGDSHSPWLAFSLQVGRQAATPFGVFVLPYRANMSIVQANKIDQVDMIAMDATILHNTIIEVITFGFDWLGYPKTLSPNEIHQNGSPGIAINMLHFLRKPDIKIYLSFAQTREGFINPNHLIDAKNILNNHQRGEAHIFASGFEYVLGKLTFSMESSASHSLESRKNEYIFSAQVSYEIPNSSMNIFFAYEYFNSHFEDETGQLLTIGVQWQILENVYFIIEGSQIWPADRDDIFAISSGLLITSHQKELKVK